MESLPVRTPDVGSERRKTDRKHLRTDAVLTLAGSERFTVRVLDISPGGLGIVASANPRSGIALQVEFVLPLRPKGAIRLSLAARVVHSVYSSAEGGFKVGLSFTQLTPEAAQAIVAYMK